MGRSLDASFEPVLSGKVYDSCLGPFTSPFGSKLDKVWNCQKMKARRNRAIRQIHVARRNLDLPVTVQPLDYRRRP